MEYHQIHLGLLELVDLLSRLGLAQLLGLSTFIAPHRSDSDLDLKALSKTLSGASPARVQAIVAQANVDFSPGRDFGLDPNTAIPQTSVLYQIYLLKDLLTRLNMNQLLKLFSILPAGELRSKQLLLLQDLQTLFAEIDRDTLSHLHSRAEHTRIASPGRELSELPKLIDLSPLRFHLYAPLNVLLTLSIEDFLSLHSVVPALNSHQLTLLARLTEIGVFDVVDLAALLVTSGMAPPSHEGVDDSMDFDDEESEAKDSLLISIVRQPPLKAVYKRNVKPHPIVRVEGPLSEIQGHLYVVPILMRTDTQEDINDKIIGNEAQRLTATTNVTFSRMKILATSHQMSETLFCLRFELRHYSGADDNDYEVLSSVVSEPFNVVSHSTQLKPTARTLPKVTEVVPFTGSEHGSTRVAILGNNFLDSPTTRVKFDDIEVMPIFHGAKTLVCHTPKHMPGTVNVYVCNEVDGWSAVCGQFTYVTPSSPLDSSGNVPHKFDASSEDSQLPELPLPSGPTLFESFGVGRVGDSFGLFRSLGASGPIPQF